VLYGKAERLAALPPYQGGGEMIGSVSMETITYADPPHRFEAGTPRSSRPVGLGAAIEWLNGFDRDAIAAHEHALYERVARASARRQRLRILGRRPARARCCPSRSRAPTPTTSPRSGPLRRRRARRHPLRRAADARFGVTSSARASFALYNTLAEADAFVDALAKARSFFS
jgi:cysteine desulfurase/selenocysteine lyase